MLGQHFLLEQAALRVVLAEPLLRDAVRPGAFRPQPPAKIPDPRTTPSGLTPFTRMASPPSSAASSRTWCACAALAEEYARLLAPAATAFLLLM